MYSCILIECAVACVLLSKGIPTHAFNSSESSLGSYGVNESTSFNLSRKAGSTMALRNETRPSLSPTRNDLAQAPSPNPMGTLSTIQTGVSNQPTQTLLSMKPTSSSSPLNDENNDYNSTPALTDIDLQPLQFYRNRLFNVICSLFFPVEAVLDGPEVTTFEQTARDFVIDHVDEINLPVVVVSVQDVTVVSQVFAWKRPQSIRVLEGAATGLNVYFQIDVVVTGYTTTDELENSIQDLFDSYDSAFLNSPYFSSADNEDKNTLYPVRMMLGIVAGCSGFVALIVVATMFVRKKRNEINQTSNQKPSMESDKELLKMGQKPVQYAVQELSQRDRVVQFGWDDMLSSIRSSSQSCEADEMSCDDSFSASLVFCPSVDKQNSDVKELFARDQGIISHSDQEVPREETVTATEDNKKMNAATNTRLSTADLDNFDDELRRAEC